MLREESVAFLAEKQKNRNHYMIIVWGIDVKIFVYKDSWFPEDKILLTLVPHANEVNMYACMYLWLFYFILQFLPEVEGLKE